MSKSRKYVVSISSIIPCEASELFDHISKTHAIHYVGIYLREDEKTSIYIHFKHAFIPSKIIKILHGLEVEVETISTYKRVEGTLITEHGEIFAQGRPKKRKRSSPCPSSSSPHTVINNTTNNTTNNIDNSTNTTNNNNINLIIVNPIGQESLEHITPEFIQNLLSENHGPEVVFQFGTEMYSLQENMNFKTDLKSGYISGRTDMDGAWETRRKNEGFSMLMDNLKSKNEEAVLKYLEDIPDDDLENFKKDMGWIREHKISRLQEHAPVYNKFIREGFNLLSANIADRVRRIERDTGKKLKLV